jgi:hypothetical protein
MSPKRIKQTDITGERGITLIHDTVLEIGFLWTPTGLEAGIDGYIEIRDPKTGAVTNNVIQVQSKATDKEFTANTADGFDYYCKQQDLDYWLGGNAPVILVRSRPSTKEAYWVSIKDYFSDLSTRQTRKIHFDKAKNKFNVNCRDALVELARPEDSGLYLSPLPKREKLYSNLLHMGRFAERIYIAETDYRYNDDLWNEFDKMGAQVGCEWVLKNKRILTFYDLTEYPWSKICDQGTVECFDTAVWALSNDPDVQRDFVWLLNRCLDEKLWPEVLYHEKGEYYFFTPTSNLKPRVLPYKSLKQPTSRVVFQAYPSKKDSTRIAYYRHSAFFARFVRLGDEWYLEITPTYHFTRDGYRLYSYHEDQLKGIKRLERNPAVLGQVVMWAAHLSGEPDLFTKPYSFLTFDYLQAFDIEAGLDDKTWLSHEEEEDAKITASPLNELPLFESLAEE